MTPPNEGLRLRRRLALALGILLLVLVPTGLFLRVQLLQLPVLRQAITAENWPAGGEALGKIRRLVGFNLLLGLLLVALASARPAL